MNRTTLAISFVVVFSVACRVSVGRSSPAPDAGPDALYWRAVAHLDASNPRGSTDSAIVLLDAYLANGRVQEHAIEARTLRRLARDARELGRVEAALAQAKTDTVVVRRPDGDTKTRTDEALKEIQRLKEELSKANEELDRIRKRLATPPVKPPR